MNIVTAEAGDTAARLALSIIDERTPANNPVTGQTPTASIRRLSDGRWWNFVASTWDTVAAYSGLGTEHKQALTSQTDGSYATTWNQNTADAGAEADYEVVFEVASGMYEGIDHEVWQFRTPVTISTQTVRDAMKLAPSAGEPAEGSIDAIIDTIAADVAGLDGDAIPDISGLALEATVAALNNFDPATQQVDIGAVKGTPVSSVDDFKANVSGLATSNEIADLQTHGDTEWAKVSAEDVDTQLSLTHGIGSWLTRADNGIHTVTVTVETSGGTTFEGVRVAASGLDESNQYVEDTDTAGQCTFYLNAGTWHFIAAQSNAQSGGAVDVDVSAAQDVSLVVTAVALPDPAPAGYCSVYAIGEYQNGADAAGTFRVSALRSPQVRDEDGIPVAVFLGDDSPALVDGRATVTVLQGAVVSFVLSTSGGTISRENVTVPTETGPVDFLSLT